MYGNLVTLSNLRLQGARPDGSIAPGADLVCIVDFDPVAAGCDTGTGVCTPGGDISWYINGEYAGESVAGGYDQSLGGFSVSSPGFTAPNNGSVTIMVKSLNQLTVAAAIVSTGEEPGEGQVQVTGVTCGTGPDYQCSCESNGELVVYFTKNVIAAGSGVAYVDVLIDNQIVLSDAPTSTAQSGTMDSAAVTCPQDGNNHTITVKGKNDVGASVVLYAGTPMGGMFANGVSGLSTPPAGSNVVPSGNVVTIPAGSLLTPASVPISLPSVDNNTILWLAGGAAVIVGGLIFAKYMMGKERQDELNYYPE
jgi:hypothetical protein